MFSKCNRELIGQFGHVNWFKITKQGEIPLPNTVHLIAHSWPCFLNAVCSVATHCWLTNSNRNAPGLFEWESYEQHVRTCLLSTFSCFHILLPIYTDTDQRWQAERLLRAHRSHLPLFIQQKTHLAHVCRVIIERQHFSIMSCNKTLALKWIECIWDVVQTEKYLWNTSVHDIYSKHHIVCVCSCDEPRTSQS